MIKKCPVILNNKAVTVVKFGDVSVQLPSIKKDVKTVFLKYENERYSIVDGMPEEPDESKPEVKSTVKKRTTKKKTTEEPKVETDNCIELE